MTDVNVGGGGLADTNKVLGENAFGNVLSGLKSDATSKIIGKGVLNESITKDIGNVVEHHTAKCPPGLQDLAALKAGVDLSSEAFVTPAQQVNRTNFHCEITTR